MSQKTLSAERRRRNYAPIFAALGDETRLSIVAKLSTGEPYSIARLTEGTNLTRQAVTKHLRVLEDAHLVHSVRAGRESLYELDPGPIREVREYAEVVSAHWDRALARLKALVEEG
ncbi:MAG: metalloregulator ArsR/SmtB family transcription factor [Gemmatimonadaceae bacterium]